MARAVLVAMAMKLLLLALVACGQREPPPAEPLASVAHEVAAPVEHARYTAVVLSKESEVLSAEFDGRVIALYVKAGQLVRAGDVIAELDDSALRSQLAGEQANERAAAGERLVASAELAKNQRNYANESRLLAQGFTATEIVRTAANEVTTAEGRVQSAAGRESAAKIKRLELERQLATAKLTAPFSGMIAALDVKKGEAAHKGTAIVRIVDPKDLVIRFAVPNGVPVALGSQVHARISGVSHAITATVLSLAKMDPPASFTMVDADLANARDARDLPVSTVGVVELD